jgi:polysaccharide biosynthesis protein
MLDIVGICRLIHQKRSNMEKSKFIKNSIIYFIGNVLTKILSFLLIPLYTSYISTADYGYYDLTISIISLVVPITFFQIWDGMFRFVYDYNEDSEKNKIISNGLFVCFIGVIIYVCEIYIAKNIFKLNIENAYLLAFYGIAFALQYMYGTIARTYKQNKLYAVSGVINTLVNLTLNLFLIKYVKMGIESLYISFFCGSIIQVLIIEHRIKPLKNFKIKYLNMKQIKKMIQFSMPIGVSTIAIWLLTGYARLKISNELGVDYNGIFAIGTRFSSIIILIVSVLQMSWQEMSYELVKEKEKKSYYEKGLQTFYNMIFCGTIFAISSTQILFEFLVAKSYYNAIYIMPLIYVYTALSSFNGFLSTQFLAEKNSKVTFYSVVIAAICNIVLINILIKRFMLVGVCISLIISFIINAVIRLYLLRKKYKLQLDYKKTVLSVIIICVYVLAYYTGIKILNMAMLIISIVIALIIFKSEILYLYNKITQGRKKIYDT